METGVEGASANFAKGAAEDCAPSPMPRSGQVDRFVDFSARIAHAVIALIVGAALRPNWIARMSLVILVGISN